MEKQIYEMKDKNAKDFGDDLTFLLQTDCPKEELEKIEKNADLIWHANEPEDLDEEELDEEFKQFASDLCGISKMEIMEIIVKRKGYVWESVSFPVIEW